jgi:phosphatidylglycerophosphate synthase
MQPGTVNTSPSVIELLATLRAKHFSAGAWRQFFSGSWAMSRTVAQNNPRLTRSWSHLTVLLCMFALFILAAISASEGLPSVLHMLPGLLVCLAWQQSDFFWHLGLNRDPQTGELRQRLGIANILTALRGLLASVLIARLVAGLSTSAHFALAIFTVGILSDILDGELARRTNTRSRLGQIMDGEVDATLYLALAFVLVQNGRMSGWVIVILLLRYLVPVLGALGSYILFARPVRFGSTLVGKYAGILQSLYFFALLLPHNRLFLTQVIATPLLVLTLVLLAAAVCMQIIMNVRRSVDEYH